MKTIGKLGMAACFAASLSYGTTWNGKLLDASCYDSNKGQSHENIAQVCAPTPSTTSFAIRTSTGKVYKVDSSSNAKLASDVQSGVLKKDTDGDIHASITGKLKDHVVSVNSVVVDKDHK
jgi:hypothetical protein